MLIFDLDGTLWDSSVQVTDCWNAVIADRIPGFRPFTLEDIYAIMGKTMKDICDTLLADYHGSDKYEIFDICMRYEVDYLLSNPGCVYDGVERTLKALALQGEKLAIVSNCQTGYIPAFMKSTGLGKYFCDYAEWGDEQLPKAQNILKVMQRNPSGKYIYIGDTENDRIAARGAGIDFVYASYGFGSVKESDFIIDSFSDLLRLPGSAFSLDKP